MSIKLNLNKNIAFISNRLFDAGVSFEKNGVQYHLEPFKLSNRDIGKTVHGFQP